MNSQTIAQVSRLFWFVFGELSSPACLFAGHILSISNGKPEFAMSDKEMAGVIFPELDADSGERRIRDWKRRLRKDQQARGLSLIHIESGYVANSQFIPTKYTIDFPAIIASGERQ